MSIKTQKELSQFFVKENDMSDKPEKKEWSFIQVYYKELSWIIGSAIGIIVSITLPICLLFLLPAWLPLSPISIPLGIFSLIALVYWGLAPLNIFFTFVNEGTAKIVVTGGKFSRALIQYKGHTFDNEWNVVPEDNNHKEPWHPFGGLRFTGFWPFQDIYVYGFAWTGVTERGERQFHEKEVLDFILLKEDVYWVEEKDAEDWNLLPLDIEVLLTIRVINPYKALFTIQNWLEAVANRVKPLIRNETTKDTYENLIVEQKAIGEQILKGAKKLKTEFKDLYGVELRKIEVKEINPPEKWRETTLLPFIAEEEAEAIKIRAEAEAGRVGTVYQAIEARGELGRLVRTLETLDRSPGEGSKWIIPIPNMIEGISQVFQKPSAPS